MTIKKVRIKKMEDVGSTKEREEKIKEKNRKKNKNKRIGGKGTKA